MSKHSTYDLDPAAKEAMSWYGWASPIGIGLFVVLICSALLLLHLAGIIH